jgi:hypothetical protein
VKRVPIKRRIAKAYRHGITYYDLLRITFPEDDYPRAFVYGSNGGPPGCAMAFGRALREMDGQRSILNGVERVYIPNAREWR